MRGARGTMPLSLTEDPRLPKASEGSQGLLRPQRGSSCPERLRGEGARAPKITHLVKLSLPDIYTRFWVPTTTGGKGAKGDRARGKGE